MYQTKQAELSRFSKACWNFATLLHRTNTSSILLLLRNTLLLYNIKNYY